MASQDEVQFSDGMGNLPSADHDGSKKDRKEPPSLDVQLAQDYREKQGLPPIGQGVDPELDGQTELCSDAEYVPIVLDKRLKIDLQTTQSWPDDRKSEVEDDDGPPRDFVTGRRLIDHGCSCLRCLEKGLRCTLNYIGKESAPQCAACRRSKAPHCVRFQPLGERSRGIPYYGPPWNNPNFVAGGPADKTAARLPREQLQEILREFYEGGSSYIMGQWMTASDVHNFALPAFNGTDVPEEDRPKNCKEMGWKDVLPDWRNRSLNPLKEEGDAYEERENSKRELALARDISLLPPNPSAEEAEAIRIRIERIQAGDSGTIQEELKFLRIVRRYQPREKNLCDIV